MGGGQVVAGNCKNYRHINILRKSHKAVLWPYNMLIAFNHRVTDHTKEVPQIGRETTPDINSAVYLIQLNLP